MKVCLYLSVVFVKAWIRNQRHGTLQRLTNNTMTSHARSSSAFSFSGELQTNIEGHTATYYIGVSKIMASLVLFYIFLRPVSCRRKINIYVYICYSKVLEFMCGGNSIVAEVI